MLYLNGTGEQTMNNCENCYHFHMCDLQYRLEEHQDCKHYKDKSLIIELPCKIGDIVYKVNPLENAYSQILVLKVLAIELSDKEVVDLKITKNIVMTSKTTTVQHLMISAKPYSLAVKKLKRN